MTRAVIIIGILVSVLGFAGWVQNIYKLAHCDFEAPYKAEVIHAVGIIPPVGAITGWLELGE